VSWFILTFVSLGSIYLLLSVGVTIYRRRHAVPTGSPVGAVASQDELESCHEELSDVTQGLEKHLANFDRLVAHYDTAEAQRWSENRSFWLGQWKAAAERCRLDNGGGGGRGKDWDELAVVHAELRETETSYTKELMRFGRDQAPRLDRARQRLDKIGERLALSRDAEDSEDSKKSRDSGESRQHKESADSTTTSDSGDGTP
jgi:hypothetical protein